MTTAIANKNLKNPISHRFPKKQNPQDIES